MARTADLLLQIAEAQIELEAAQKATQESLKAFIDSLRKGGNGHTSNLLSEAARRMNAARKTRAGGRPRSNAKRCPCGAMTLKRAQARGCSAEHEPSCTFYRDRAMIV